MDDTNSTESGMSRQPASTNRAPMGVAMRLRGHPVLVAAALMTMVVVVTGDLITARRPHELSAFLNLPGWVAIAVLAAAVLSAALTARDLKRRATHPAVKDDSLPVAPPSDDVPAVFLENLLVRNGRTTTIVPTSDLLRIEADGRYVWLVTPGRRQLAQYTLKSLESRLDPAVFARIHRSTIVNVRRVRQLKSSNHRDYYVLADDGVSVRMSRLYYKRLTSALGASVDRGTVL